MTAGLTLSAGMNDFLVPREQFLYSPLGQAIFLGKSTSYNASAGAPPLVGSTEQGYITGFDGANLMVDLGAYWQNRAIDTNDGTITPSTETGTPAGNPLEVQVMAASSATSANTGGLPSNPNLYSTLGDPSALQSIVTLNITAPPLLDLLLAALIDNTTGGPNAVNGTLESVTYQVGFLGLNGAVGNAISNATEPNDGLYGAPASHFPPPPPPSGWGAFWNAVTSFVTNPLGTVLSLVSVVWNAATAAFTYLNHLAHEAVAIGVQVLARAAATLVSIGKAIFNALEQLLLYLVSIVNALVAAVLNPIIQQFANYGSTLLSDSSAISGGNTKTSELLQFWSDAGGPLFLALFALAAVIEIALTLLSAVSLGAGFIIDLLIGFVVTAAATVATALTGSFFSGLSSWGSSAIFALGACCTALPISRRVV